MSAGTPSGIAEGGGALLVDHHIRELVEGDALGVAPFDPHLLQPASLDLRLGASYRRFTLSPQMLTWVNDRDDPTKTVLDTASLPENLTTLYENDGGGPIDVAPGEMVLGHSVERFRFPDWIAGRLEGKSGLARIGLSPHITAGFFDPGFEGDATPELLNVSPYTIRLHPGMLIAQMCFFLTHSYSHEPYGVTKGHYGGQQGPTESRSIITRPGVPPNPGVPRSSM